MAHVRLPPCFSTFSASLRKQSSNSARICHTPHSLDLGGSTHADLVLLRKVMDFLEAPYHDLFQLIVDFAFGPEKTLQILDPLKVRNDDPTCIAQDVGNEECPIL